MWQEEYECWRASIKYPQICCLYRLQRMILGDTHTHTQTLLALFGDYTEGFISSPDFPSASSGSSNGPLWVLVKVTADERRLLFSFGTKNHQTSSHSQHQQPYSSLICCSSLRRSVVKWFWCPTGDGFHHRRIWRRILVKLLLSGSSPGCFEFEGGEVPLHHEMKFFWRWKAFFSCFFFDPSSIQRP